MFRRSASLAIPLRELFSAIPPVSLPVDRELLHFKFLVNLFLTNLVRISGFSSLFLAIAVLSAHFAREC